MRYIKIKALLFILALGLMFPAAAYAAHDPSETQSDNNDLNLQNIQWHQDSAGNWIGTMYTEKTGDNRRGEGSYVHTISLTGKIVVSGSDNGAGYLMMACNDDYAGHHVGFSDEPGDKDSNGNGIIIPSSERYLNGITVNTTSGKASAVPLLK